MSNQLVNKENGPLPTVASEVFGTEGIDNSDLMLPRLLLMQKMSKLLDDPNMKAKDGDLVNSLTKEVLSTGKPVEFVPLFSKKFWRETEGEKNTKQNTRRFLFTAENSDLPYDYTAEDGRVGRRNQEIDWFCLLPGEIAEGTALPCVITFKKTSMQAGKKLNTFVKQSAMLKLPACGNAYELQWTKKSNDQGTFHVFDIGKKRLTTKVELDAATLWYKTLNHVKYATHDGKGAE